MAAKREILVNDIPDAYIQRLSGKPYITHKGLLALAHEHGIEGISTEMIQWEAGEAIIHATAKGTRGTYTGYGDASPKNVNSMLNTACIRLAETRAVNRALRLYLGIGITSLDEMPNMTNQENSEPSDDWSDFCEAVTGLGLDIETVGAYCEAKGRPSPRQMETAQRKMLFAHLESESGKTAITEFIKGA